MPQIRKVQGLMMAACHPYPGPRVFCSQEPLVHISFFLSIFPAFRVDQSSPTEYLCRLLVQSIRSWAQAQAIQEVWYSRCARAFAPPSGRCERRQSHTDQLRCNMSSSGMSLSYFELILPVAGVLLLRCYCTTKLLLVQDLRCCNEKQD